MWHFLYVDSEKTRLRMAAVILTRAHQKRTISMENAVADVPVVATAITSVTSQLNPVEIHFTTAILTIEPLTVKIKHNRLPKNFTDNL